MGISTMAAVELDPNFIKALRLLRSKSKDSGAQLRAMLDDAIRQKKGLGPAPRSPSVSKQHSRSVSSDRTIDKDRSEKDKKKDLDRLKKDLSELADKPTDPKRARLDSPALSSSSHTPSPTPPPSREEGDVSDGGSDVEFGDLEMNLEFDCSCCVCKTFTQESGNKLMECSSCQNLYHQECHNPPVSNHEASDPRLIWNCVKCTKKSVPGGKPASSSSSSLLKEERKSEKEKSSKSSLSSGSSSKRSSSSSRHKPSPAKGDSGRGSSVTGSSGSSKSKSGSSSGASSSSGTSSNTELSSSARKRIKLIKKQAAAATSISKKKSK